MSYRRDFSAGGRVVGAVCTFAFGLFICGETVPARGVMLPTVGWSNGVEKTIGAQNGGRRRRHHSRHADARRPSNCAKTIWGGVLNNRARVLPPPVYPPFGRNVRARGTVVVWVSVNEAGSVVGAKALSGHPLLRASAVGAAYRAKFTPVIVQGPPVKIAGLLIYDIAP